MKKVRRAVNELHLSIYTILLFTYKQDEANQNTSKYVYT